MAKLLTFLSLLLVAFKVQAATPELRASVEVNRLQAHVNEQILVTVRVAAPTDAFNVTDPYLKLENVDLYPLHKREFDQSIDSTSFKVSEIVYAVFGRLPGEAVIPSLSFKATLPITDSGTSSNPILNAETIVQRLTIIPAPVSDVVWLPAQSVSIHSDWPSGKNTILRAGEPIERILSIQIEGQHPAAIPDIALPEVKGIKSYPDLPLLNLQKSTTGVGGTQTTSVTLIAERAMTVTLPAIDIDWWDYNDRSWKQATLDAETLTVQPAVSSLTWLDARNRYRVALLLLSLLALACAISSAILWCKLRKLDVQKNMQARKTRPVSEKLAWSKLQHSLKKKQPVQARQHMLVWARIRWPNQSITRLDQLDRIDHTLASAAVELTESLYAREPKREANYRAITQALRRLRKAGTRVTRQSPGRYRQALYPVHRNKPG